MESRVANKCLLAQSSIRAAPQIGTYTDSFDGAMCQYETRTRGVGVRECASQICAAPLTIDILYIVNSSGSKPLFVSILPYRRVLLLLVGVDGVVAYLRCQ